MIFEGGLIDFSKNLALKRRLISNEEIEIMIINNGAAFVSSDSLLDTVRAYENVKK